MTSTFAYLRAEARRRWPSWLAVIVLVGVVGGLTLGALAGARRTHTAYDRLVADTEAWDMLINPNEGAESAVDPAEVAALPGVAQLGTVDGVGAVLVHEGEPTLGSGPLLLAAGDDEVLVDFARPGVIEGELFDPNDPTHVMVDDTVADDYGLAAGDRVEVATAHLDDLIEWEMAGGEGVPPLTRRPAVVTGIGVSHDGVVEDEAFAYGTVYVSHAFAEAYELEPFFYGMAVLLEPGASPLDVRKAVQAMAPDEAFEFKTEAAVRDTVERGTMPHTVALLLFAAVVGLAGLVVTGQALSRQLDPLRTEASTLLAMGVDRRQLRAAGLVRTALLVVPGVVLGLGLAVAASPLFPVGVAERAEVAPGLDVDIAVLAPAALLLLVVLLAWGAVAVRRVGRPALRVPAAGRAGLTERLATAVSNPIATSGLRAALAPRASTRAVPVRAALVGLSLAVAAVAATMTFGANIDHLVSTPAEYGWDWDAFISLPMDGFHTSADVFVERAEASPELTGWSRLTVDQVELDGERVPAVGVEYRRGDVGPSILAGRRPDGPGEVVLGGRTMDLLGVGIGERVDTTEGRSFEVVGQAVFPGLGTYPGADRTELGKGALFTIDDLAEVGEGFGFPSLVLDTDDDATLDTVLDRMLRGQSAAIEMEEIEVFREPARPADVTSLTRVRTTPLLVAGVLAVLGGVGSALVAVPVVLAAAGLWVLAGGDGLDGAAVVRGVLVALFAGAGRVAWRAPALRAIGALVLVGLSVAGLELLCSAIAWRYPDADLAGAGASLAAPLVLAVAFHALATLPDGRVGSRAGVTVLVVGYFAAVVIGVLHWADRPDPSPWPFAALGAVLLAVGLARSHRRYLDARGPARQRMQWLGLALALVAQTAVVVGALDVLVGWPGDPALVVGASLGLVAGALGAAASSRLVGQVDRLLRHAVSAGGLSVVVVGVYLVVIVGLGRVPSDDERSVLVLSMLAAAVSAVLYLPARDRLTVAADRLVYGAPQDPSQALDTFGSRMTRALPMEELLLQLAELAKKHFGLRAAEVWTGVAGRLVRAASVPDVGPGTIRLGATELPVVTRAGVCSRGWAAVWLPQVLDGRGDGPIRIAPMSHAGQLLGLLVLERPPGDDEFSQEDDRVLTELARQVGLALQNSELDNALKATLEEVQRKNVELQESRARVVASGDAERRRIERNLHDGAQQHLVALAVKLRLVQRLAESNPEQAMAMVEEARHDVLATVEEVRALAHGIYPPLLMDRGLPEALQAAAGRAALPTSVTADGVGRYEQEVEAAVYFCILEALQNAGKHAGGSASVEVELRNVDGELRFSVTDDGAGFDLADRASGHGFLNMADRLGAIGGAVEVWSAPDRGTRIAGRVPATPRPTEAAEPQPVTG